MIDKFWRGQLHIVNFIIYLSLNLNVKRGKMGKRTFALRNERVVKTLKLDCSSGLPRYFLSYHPARVLSAHSLLQN